jgi:hypothetical protein
MAIRNDGVNGTFAMPIVFNLSVLLSAHTAWWWG